MNRLRQSWRICLFDLRQWRATPRVWVICILLFLLMHYVLSPILSFAKSVSVPVTPYVLPFLLSDYYVPAMLALGAVALFCDAPFLFEQTPYQIIRGGKKVWFAGQILYIITGAFLYTGVVTIASVIWLLPKITFAPNWGKVLNTLAQTDAGIQNQIYLSVSYGIIKSYTPLQGMLLSFLLLWLLTILIGAMIFLFNLLLRKIGGILAGILIAFTGFFTKAVGDYVVYYFSPVDWVDLQILDRTGLTHYPSLTFVLLALPCLSLLCIVLSANLAARRAVEI